VLFQSWRRGIILGVLLAVANTPGILGVGQAQEENARKVKSKVTPVYPELARQMNIGGVVKVQVRVASSGEVKDMRVIGGHPVLVNAVVNAVQKWRYEARPQETTESLEFHFEPNER